MKKQGIFQYVASVGSGEQFHHRAGSVKCQLIRNHSHGIFARFNLQRNYKRYHFKFPLSVRAQGIPRQSRNRN